MAMEYSKSQPRLMALLDLSKDLLISTRPKQWTKNLLVYCALLFSIGEAWSLDDPGLALSLFGKTTLAFVLFSALAGAVYLVNDIFDIEKDRRHPKKRSRPLAAGRLPVPVAWTGAAGLAVVGLSVSFIMEPVFGLVALGYLVLMVAYSVALKYVVLLDVFSISGGFMLRAVAGAVVLQAPISPWLYACTGLGALLIALVKRRSELSQAGDEAVTQRGTLEWYSTPLLDQFVAIVAPSALLAYTLYTFTAPNLPENHAMMVTVPFVVYALFRYLYRVHVSNMGENPEDILISDAPLIVSIGLWLATAATVLAVFRA
jgi:4-hydroxybenzoate polyprenyltransferase